MLNDFDIRSCVDCGSDMESWTSKMVRCDPCKDRRNKNARYLKVYGITSAVVDQMRLSQGGKCPICNVELSTGMAVDHDHDTGLVRGLLCRECNLRLGTLEDLDRRPRWTAAARAYLKR